MRLADQLTLPLIALWQQKSRTVLTTLGVVFGALVMAASLSIGQGVQDTIDYITGQYDLLRTIAVSARWRPAEKQIKQVEVAGKMSPAKQKRIRRALASQASNQGSAVEPLSRKRWSELAKMEHVGVAVPVLNQGAQAFLGDREQNTSIGSARPDDPACQRRLVAGRMFTAADERAVVVSEFLLYQLGITDDQDIAGVVGQTLTLEFRQLYESPGLIVHLVKPDGGATTSEERAAIDKMIRNLPKVIGQLDLSLAELALLSQSIAPGAARDRTHSVELPIVGVIRLATDEDKRGLWEPLAVTSDCIVPYETAMNLADELHGENKWDLSQVIVLVDDEQHTRDVYNQIQASGLQAFAPLDEVDRERLTYTLVFGGMTCVAAVAMLVSALGIANTMLMGVLERTREIGIMKAVGAAPSQLMIVFLIEGALIGLVGGVLGMLAAWAASFPGDAWVKSMVAGKFPFELEKPLFVFPAWLVATVLVFSVVVTTLAAVLPARRAASIDPVTALRHE